MATAVFVASGWALPASAQEYPSRPIRMVVPFAPGGGTDVVARLVGQGLTQAWGQPMVIDNRPGAGTMLGTEIAARSAPDGHTILICAAAHAINPSLYRKVTYDVAKDFAPVTLAVGFPFLLVVHPSVPAQNVAELVALAKSRPGKVAFASSGAGNTNHLAGELLKGMAGVDMVHVPYKGGGPALNDLVGGQIQMMFGTVLETLPQVKGGRLRALAVSGTRRASFAPEIPTVAESGLPGFDVTGWYAFLVPAATPAPILAKLNREMTRILETGAVRDRLVTLGSEPWPTSSAQAQAFIVGEVARWARVIKAAGIRPD